MTNTLKDLARTYLDALGSFDRDIAAPLMHADYVAQIPCITMRPDTYDKAGFLGYFDYLRNFLPDGINFTISEMTAEDDRVAIVASGQATTIEGKPYNNRYHILVQFKDGKAIRHLEYMDSYLGAKVLGPLMQKT